MGRLAMLSLSDYNRRGQPQASIMRKYLLINQAYL
jgi:hypothetical protein